MCAVGRKRRKKDDARNGKWNAGRTAAGAVLAAGLTMFSSWSAYAGWELDDAGQWMHRAENGETDTGWFQEADGGWYYLGEDGRLRTAQWMSGGGETWYYLHVDGRMLAGQWFQDGDGRWYYLGAAGAMLKTCRTPDGYWVQADGSWDGRAAGSAAGSGGTAGSGGPTGSSASAGSSALAGSSGVGGSSSGGSSGGSSGSSGGSSGSGDGGSSSVGSGGSGSSGSGSSSSGFPTEIPDDGAMEEMAVLASWLARARAAESAVTGEPPEDIPDSRFLVSDASGQDTRLITAAGRLAGGIWDGASLPSDRQELYLIGKNWIPDGVVLSMTYPDELSYSHQNLGSVSIGEEIYTLSKFILVRKSDKDSIQQDKGEASGSSGYWKEGDLLEREIDGETYTFRCIDQNYSDGIQEADGLALFLCDQVIPADYGSEYEPAETENGSFAYQFIPGPIVRFGASKDYKHSDIRRWLQESELDFSDAQPVQIGVSYAYFGSTEQGRYAALDEAGLRAEYLGSQRMTDRLFILSMEEALEYRDQLWSFGGEEENPESQISPFCKGYWLRSPAGASSEDGQEMVYMVDLVNGNLRPEPAAPQGSLEENENAGTDDDTEADRDPECRLTGTTGVRPAFVMEQIYAAR